MPSPPLPPPPPSTHPSFQPSIHPPTRKVRFGLRLFPLSFSLRHKDCISMTRPPPPHSLKKSRFPKVPQNTLFRFFLLKFSALGGKGRFGLRLFPLSFSLRHKDCLFMTRPPPLSEEIPVSQSTSKHSFPPLFIEVFCPGRQGALWASSLSSVFLSATQRSPLYDARELSPNLYSSVVRHNCALSEGELNENPVEDD